MNDINSNQQQAVPVNPDNRQINPTPSELNLNTPTSKSDTSSPPQNPSQKPNRNKTLIVAVVIFFLLLITGVSVTYYLESGRESGPDSKSTISDQVKETNPISGREVKTHNLIRGVYAVQEGAFLNVYSVSLDGLYKETIISREIGETNREPNQSIQAKISPNGSILAYSVGTTDVTIMDITSKNEIATIDAVESFSWSDDGRLLHLIRRKEQSTSSSSIIEPPIYPTVSKEYYSFDLATREEIKDDDDYGGNRYLVKVRGDEILTVSSSAYGGVPNRLFVYKTSTGDSTPVDLLGNEQVSTAITNNNQTRTILSLLPGSWGINYSCKIYELENFELKSIVEKDNYDCTLGRGSFVWNSDDEFFYNRGTGVNGEISTSDTTESGLYIISSIYKYNFNSNKDEVVLQGDASKTYQIFGLLPEKRMVVFERSGTTDDMELQFRDLDGSNSVILIKTTGNNTPYFIGWSS